MAKYYVTNEEEQKKKNAANKAAYLAAGMAVEAKNKEKKDFDTFLRGSFDFRPANVNALTQATALAGKATEDYEASKEKLDAYKNSEEAKKNQQAANRKAIEEATRKIFAVPGVSASDMPLTSKDAYAGADTKKLALEKETAYYENQKVAAENDVTTEKNLKELESWSEEDRRALDFYIAERNQKLNDMLTGNMKLEVYKQDPLVGKYGERKVRQMAESLERSRSRKLAEDTQEAAKKANPILGSIASVGTGIVGAVTAPIEYAKEMTKRTGQYTTLDPNNIGTIPNIYGQTVRQETTQKIQGDGNNWLRNLAAIGYQGAMSAADSAARLAVSGYNPGISAAIAASGSFGNGLQKYSQQGASPEQAAAMALLEAGIEYATEKVSDAELLDFFKNGKDAKKAKDFLWHTFGVEPLSEEISLFANTAAEMVILKDKSSQSQKIGELVANGMSYEEAQAQVMREFWKEAAQTYAVSAVAAGIGSAGQYQLGKAVNTDKKTQAEQTAQQPQEAAVSTASKGEQITQKAAEMMAQPKQEAAVPDVDKETSLANALAEVTGKNNIDNSEEHRIKAQMIEKQNDINTMDPVANIQTPPNFESMTKTERKDWVVKKLQSTGYKVDRKGFGVIHFAEKRLKKAFNYLKKGSVEQAAFEAMPYVLENGIEIGEHSDHKGREYGTVTFAAPVIIDGKRGNMAVVVTKTTDNFYKVHRILTPDGTVFKLDGKITEAEPSLAGESPDTGSLATPISSASTTTVANNSPVVNNQNVSNQNEGIQGTGAAERGFTPKQALINKYGNIPEGENPVRPDQLPQSTNGEDRVSYTARTVMEARVTPDEFVPLIENEAVRGGYSFIPITNDETVRTAIQNIAREGWRTARANWTASVRAGVTSPEITATGALLYNHAVNAGDFQEALDILVDYQMAVRNTAKSLQAARILKTLTPSDRLWMIRRSVDAMVQDMNLRNPVTIDENLAQQYQNAGTEEEANEILDQIAEDVARQIPATGMERFTALRYLNMLGNFRTQVRNVAGNIGSKLVYGLKDKIGAAVETIASAVTGGRIERTKSFVTDRNTRQAANADYDNVRDWIMSNGRYNDQTESEDFARRVQDRRRILPVGLEQYRRATNWAMEAGDQVFARDAYARSLAGYLNARGIRTDNLETVDPQILERAREYAVRQAQEQTFRDNNQVSDFVSGLLRGNNTPAWARVIGEGIIPFRRTPANVLVRAEEYSPLGLINSTVNTIRAARGEISGAELVESWSKTLTGTALMAMGMALHNLGVLNGGPDEDEEKEGFDQLNGKQDYSLNFTVDGKTYSYTIDWATPAAMPLFLGAQLQKLLSREEDLQWSDYEKVLTAIGDPLISMSMLQGVNDTLENIRYSENNMGQFLINATMSYLTQGLTNTLLGQIERSTEENRQTTFVNKDSNVPQWLQKQLGKASQKIPGWDYQQTDYLNAWGQTDKNKGGLLYNLLSPGYISQEQAGKLTEELYRLHEATGENVFPATGDKTVSYTDSNGVAHKNYNLSAQEYETLQKAQGHTAQQMLSGFLDSAVYNAMTDAQKAKAIEYVKDYAREKGRSEALQGYEMAAAWMADVTGAESILQRTIDNSISKAISDNSAEGLEQAAAAFDAMTVKQQAEMAESGGKVEYYLKAKNAGVSAETFLDLYAKFKEIDESDKKQTQKAQEWSYVLEKAKNNKAITTAQRNVLRDNMVFYQQMAAESEKFNQMTAAGVKIDTAKMIDDALKNLKPKNGKATATDSQQAAKIAGMNISDKDKVAAMKLYIPDAQDKNLDDMMDLGYDPDQYALAYSLYTGESSGTGKKARTISKLRKEFGADAYKIYNIFAKP